jgi:hypothetical protein
MAAALWLTNGVHSIGVAKCLGDSSYVLFGWYAGTAAGPGQYSEDRAVISQRAGDWDTIMPPDTIT